MEKTTKEKKLYLLDETFSRIRYFEGRIENSKGFGKEDFDFTDSELGKLTQEYFQIFEEAKQKMSVLQEKLIQMLQTKD
ncbi:hypothetical protein RyT2_07710 [Pseudolactococcus yaeyamensis]